MSTTLARPDAAAPTALETPIIEVKGVSRRFSKTLDFAGRIAKKLGAPVREETVHAVDKVDLTIRKGEVVGLVGESGCGKSTLGRMVAGILPPSDGEILWRGRNRSTLSAREAREAKLRAQMIFQDPMSSLNPRLRVADIVGEAPLVHGMTTRSGLDAYVDDQLRRAGLDPAYKRRYPHQFSGGQRQRIGIARALATKPDFLILDEPTSALDVSVQAQVLNLLHELQAQLGLTYFFISHDLGVIRYICDRVALIYRGQLVEEGDTEAVFRSPASDYARMLLAAMPDPDPDRSPFHASSHATRPAPGPGQPPAASP